MVSPHYMHIYGTRFEVFFSNQNQSNAKRKTFDPLLSPKSDMIFKINIRFGMDHY
jgi:hypothetical protein